MGALSRLPSRDARGRVRVVVETPRGATAKLKYEPELAAFTLVRPLPLGLAYPYDWGFVPSTRADDGDPLDAMILLEGATAPGVVVACRPVAILRVSQDAKGGGARQRNDRVLVVPADHPRYDAVRGPDDLGARAREELEAFFLAVVQFTEKRAAIEGWGDAAEAEAAIARAEQRARENNP